MKFFWIFLFQFINKFKIYQLFRQYLLVASLAGVTITQIMFVVFGVTAETNSSLPIILIAIAAFSLHCGVFPLTFVIVPEIVPEKVSIILCY